VDTNSSKKLRDIKINSNHVEAIVLEKGDRACSVTSQVETRRCARPEQVGLTATWPLLRATRKMWPWPWTKPINRLFVVTRKPGKLIVLNSDSGKVIADLPAVGFVDDMSYDAKQRRLYLAGDQFVDVSNKRIPTITLCWPKFPEVFAPRRASWFRNSIATISLSRITKRKTLKCASTRCNPKERGDAISTSSLSADGNHT